MYRGRKRNEREGEDNLRYGLQGQVEESKDEGSKVLGVEEVPSFLDVRLRAATAPQSRQENERQRGFSGLRATSCS
jgi:hypothetical protein